MKVSTILDHIDSGHMALPEFQRGYVWNREQVRGLMDSLYSNHPVGSLLVWVTASDHADSRGDQALAPGVVNLLLDGQQRITSLYGIIRGRAPTFFDGNEKAFLDLYFHLEAQTFEFYGPVKMSQDPRWISVTDLMQKGVGEFFSQVHEQPQLAPRIAEYMERMNAITNIKEREFHVEEITGEDKTVDVVVEVFNHVNSGGTKLSKGDLALAKVCAQWPQARKEMQDRLSRWRAEGFNFKLDWLLRTINTTLTGEARFIALKDVSPQEFKQGLDRAEHHVDRLLNLIGSRLGLDHDQVLKGKFALPVLARYSEQHGRQLENQTERDRLLYWYVHSFLWGRHNTATDTVLNQDLGAIEDNDGALDRLISLLRQQRGDLRLDPDDFRGSSRGARFYPLLYMLSRVFGARDWGTGVEIKSSLLGKQSNLQLHHIFPKARLYEFGYDKPDVNALANFTFLTQETNLSISARDPAEYLPEVEERNPGALASHWIPMDPDLWDLSRYHDFLAARRELLAKAGNELLESLYHGAIPEQELVEIRPTEAVIPGSVDSDDELSELIEIADWVLRHQLPEGELGMELVDQETGDLLAILDLAWPEGLQPGLSEPVAVLLNENSATEEAANHAGFHFFTNGESFRHYVLREVLGEREAA